MKNNSIPNNNPAVETAKTIYQRILDTEKENINVLDLTEMLLKALPINKNETLTDSKNSIFDYDSYELPHDGEIMLFVGIINRVLFIFQNTPPLLKEYLCFKLTVSESELKDFVVYTIRDEKIISSHDIRLNAAKELIGEMFCKYLQDHIDSLLLRFYSFVERLNSTVLYDNSFPEICNN